MSVAFGALMLTQVMGVHTVIESKKQGVCMRKGLAGAARGTFPPEALQIRE